VTVFHNQAVDVLRPGTRTNRAGETVLEYSKLEQQPGAPWRGVYVRPTSQAERVDEERETAVSGWRIASAPGSPDVDLRSTDWVRLPSGEVCRVVGDVARPADPFTGQLDHVEVFVTRAAG
jgi:hypothetical protein